MLIACKCLDSMYLVFDSETQIIDSVFWTIDDLRANYPDLANNVARCAELRENYREQGEGA